jgi:rod shape-determining protein MreC
MASVTGQSPTLWYATLQINKGTSSGVRDGMPAIASDGDKGDEGGGLIGKVDSTGPDWAKIRLITDSQMAVGADTVGGGARGVLKPTPGNPRDLILEYSGKDDAVRKGDVVVTAGTTSARNDLLSPFPKDVPIGRVTKIDDPGSEQQEVHVRPFVDITRVEYVQVLTQKVNDNR